MTEWEVTYHQVRTRSVRVSAPSSIGAIEAALEAQGTATEVGWEEGDERVQVRRVGAPPPAKINAKELVGNPEDFG